MNYELLAAGNRENELKQSEKRHFKKAKAMVLKVHFGEECERSGKMHLVRCLRQQLVYWVNHRLSL